MKSVDTESQPSNPLRDLRRFQKIFEDGEVVFEQGSRGSSMYVIVEGAVHIRTHHSAAGRTLTTLGPGACFGELALVMSGLRTAAACAAATPTRVVEIDKARFVYLVGQQPAFALTVLRGLARRIEQLSPSQPTTGGASEADGAAPLCCIPADGGLGADRHGGCS